MNLFLIALGKLVLFLSQTFKLGSGSTWPGHVAMETNPRFVKQILDKNPDLKVVFIAGTNGKTTTSLMLQKLLEEAGHKVFRNAAGANLLNGIASSLIENVNLTGRLSFSVAIFEVDESNFPLAVKEANPYAIVLLNLFRDQLDRYGEVNTIAKKWEEALAKLPKETMIITNGDDPKLSYLALNSKNKSYFFGIDEKEMTADQKPYDVDFTYCPKCQTKLKYSKISYSHLGKFKCPNCDFTNPESLTFSSLPHPLFGKYNIYNINAATLTASKFDGVTKDLAHKVFENFKPAFGRQEVLKYKNREIIMLLSKNPAGFNQSIDAIRTLNKSGNILLVLNDRIPDGRDVSWIWDVDFENLPADSKVFISGDRAYDMGLRIKYIGTRKLETNIFPVLEHALDTALEYTKPDETLFILPTYSAMLEARKILTGKKIL